jgi:DNA-binding MarR family transcriptional regulator
VLKVTTPISTANSIILVLRRNICQYLRNKLQKDCVVTKSLEFLGDMRPAFVAHLAERLTDALCISTQSLADAAGLQAPIRTHSVLLFLLERGPASLTEMARSDGQSHQLLASRLKPLEKHGLIERLMDPTDARRHPYKLTQSGQAEALIVRAAIGEHARAMNDLFAETGVDLLAALDDALEALRIRPLQDRMSGQPQRRRQSASQA